MPGHYADMQICFENEMTDKCQSADRPEITNAEGDSLFGQSVDLAYLRFPDVTDQHVMEMYSHLLWGWRHGAAEGGHCLVH